VSNKRGHRGEREISRKTIARGMPGRSGVTVVTNSCVCFFTHEAAGASRARHSLRPLIPQGAKVHAQLGRIASRDRDGMCHRHCEEPLRRSNPTFFAARWIASSLPPSLDELRRTVAPRNDGGESAPHSHSSSPGLTGRPSIPETPENNREAAAYWIVRSSRTTTVVWEATKQLSTSSPAARGPITTAVPWSRSRQPLVPNAGPRRMGPCFRRDDV
jgi:hypothetical protein